MTEHKNLIEKPKRTLSDALHAVKGENTAKLIEEFTSEMTLVAEGLCEDQQKLRHAVEAQETRLDERLQSQESHISMLEKLIDEERSDHDKALTELRNRLASLEKQSKSEPRNNKKEKRNIIRELTFLVFIIAIACIAVALINKLL